MRRLGEAEAAVGLEDPARLPQSGVPVRHVVDHTRLEDGVEVIILAGHLGGVGDPQIQRPVFEV